MLRSPKRCIWISYSRVGFSPLPLEFRLSILSKIASLKYKSPILFVLPDQLSTLFLELTKLKDAKPPHPQIEEFQNVCDTAILSGCVLTISGDMYPELY
jgi:hypothetical protein